MSEAYDFAYNVSLQADRFVAENTFAVKPDQIGLDIRSGWGITISNDLTAIVINKAADRSLQYYGGFEYVEKDCRKEIGDYVFYFAEDSRVQEHIDFYKNHK